MFVKAQRLQRKLRLALLGPTGSGKTYTALQIARGIVGPQGRIALIDTENFSASLYADRVEFDVLGLTTFSPGEYVKAIQAAEAAGYDIVVIDSLSHAWSGKDGALERVDRKAAASNSGSSFHAWRDITPQHNAMVDALVHCKCHLIVTMRVKMEHVQEKDHNGRTVIRKVGLQAVQREGLEYEFDVVADINTDHIFSVSKTRCSELDGKVIEKPTHALGEQLIGWLKRGAPAPSTAPAPPPAATAPVGMSLKAKAISMIAEWSGFAVKTEELKNAGLACIARAGLTAPLDDAGAAALIKWVGEHRSQPFAEVMSTPAHPDEQDWDAAPAPPASTAPLDPPAEAPEPKPDPALVPQDDAPFADDLPGEAQERASQRAVADEFQQQVNSLGSEPPSPCTTVVRSAGVERSGKNGKTPWVLHKIETDAGWFVSYSSTVFAAAKKSVGKPANIEWHRSKVGREVQRLQPAS